MRFKKMFSETIHAFVSGMKVWARDVWPDAKDPVKTGLKQALEVIEDAIDGMNSYSFIAKKKLDAGSDHKPIMRSLVIEALISRFTHDIYRTVYADDGSPPFDFDDGFIIYLSPKTKETFLTEGTLEILLIDLTDLRDVKLGEVAEKPNAIYFVRNDLGGWREMPYADINFEEDEAYYWILETSNEKDTD